MRFSTLAAVSFGAVATAALPTISTNGQYFFTSDGDRWFVKGIAYQLAPSDPLIDTAQCQRDAAMMKQLGANAIRVYHVTEPADHSGCMNAFADAGIYVFLDLDTFSTYIIPQGTTTPMWTTAQQTAYQAVMDDFQSYSNVAGFFIGNEVVADPSTTEAAVYIKAATRDMKAYRASKNYRNIPIGYSHADISQLRPNFQNYLACGDQDDALEFFSLNTYEWCGSNTYMGSGYATLTQEVANYSIPVFISETGCNLPEPRLFQDQAAIFGPEMMPYWSGAIIYEYINEVNNYGLISFGGNTNALGPPVAETAVVRSGTPTPVTPDFANLMSAWATVTPTGIASSAYTPSNSPPSCPAYASGTWEINGDVALPSINEAYNSAIAASITAGSPQGQSASATTSGTMGTGSGSATGSVTGSMTSATGSAAQASPTGAASRLSMSGDGLVGMGLGLGGVMLGFAYWL